MIISHLLIKKYYYFSIINILKSNTPLKDIDNLLIDYCKQFFIHYNNSNNTFYYNYNDINPLNISGFFLFNPNIEQELYYKVLDDSIELYSEIDKIYIDNMIKDIDKSKLFNIKNNWGFTLYSKRFKFRNSIVLKVVKSNTKIKKI